jgi:predicted Rossmann-fold nucleotide-binding protein
VQFIEHAIEEAFINPAHRDLIVVDDNPARLLERMANHQMPKVRKWLGPEEI